MYSSGFVAIGATLQLYTPSERLARVFHFKRVYVMRMEKVEFSVSLRNRSKSARLP